ncbi:MAG: hypothetical protein ABSG65_31405 [Bryobacteraceae bacterium]|jgi:hypothetical protein
MKWVLLAVAALVVLIGLAALVGAALPLRHHASRKARFRVSPEALYAVIAGPPDWRTGVKRFGILPDKDGRRQWWEEDSHSQKIVYELVEDVAPKRIAVRIADRNLPFGGTWSFDIAPVQGGGSELRISEDGEIYNTIFRFMARFFFGYTASIEGYLRDLGTKFSQAVEIEA